MVPNCWGSIEQLWLTPCVCYTNSVISSNQSPKLPKGVWLLPRVCSAPVDKLGILCIRTASWSYCRNISTFGKLRYRPVLFPISISLSTYGHFMGSLPKHQHLRQRCYRTAVFNGKIANTYHNKAWRYKSIGVYYSIRRQASRQRFAELKTLSYILRILLSTEDTPLLTVTNPEICFVRPSRMAGHWIVFRDNA